MRFLLKKDITKQKRLKLQSGQEFQQELFIATLRIRKKYISAFKNYLDNLSDRLFRELEKISPSDLSSFVDGWIAAYLELYASSGRTLAQLRMMTIDDKEIKHHFSASESTYFSKVIEILGKNGIIHDNIYEKIYACCVLVDTLRQENSVFSHNELNFTVFKQQIKSAIMALLSN